MCSMNFDMSDAGRHAMLLARRRVVNHYQPIINLQSGKVLGVEVLGRLIDGDRIISPGVFLPGLDTVQLGQLLFVSLDNGLSALAAADGVHPDLFMSFNVGPAVMLRHDFTQTLLETLGGRRVPAHRITLEILEDDEFFSVPAAQSVLAELREAGIRIAFDDVGTGYSSLNRLRELSADKIKLDQAFIRELRADPAGLHFVGAMQSLARGLRSMLIVEGVETPEIMGALGVMGVEAAQGYAIARPMPEAALLEWLADHVPAPAGRRPRSLLAAYAAHLSIVEACRALFNQPLRFSWASDIQDPHACAVGQYFDAHGLHDTAFGRAHKRFHQVIDQHDEDPGAWEQATSDLWRTLQDAIRAETTDAPPKAPARPATGQPASPPAFQAADRCSRSCFGEQREQVRAWQPSILDHATLNA